MCSHPSDCEGRGGKGQGQGNQWQQPQQKGKRNNGKGKESGKDKTKNVIILGVGALTFAVALWLVRSQATVNDEEYMAAMIPHHSIAIMTSERASLKDPRVRELAQAIIVAQRREIAEMKYLIDDIEQNGPRTEERLPEEMQQ